MEIMPHEVDLIEVFASDDPILAFSGSSSPPIRPDIEIEFAGTASGAPGLSYRGLDGLIEGWRDWLTPWQSYHIRVEDVLDAGANVVVLAAVRARTSRDGVEVEHRPAAVWTIRDGSVMAVHFFLERAEALRFAGIER
jgi:ketosteroid isomerase-like protein